MSLADSFQLLSCIVLGGILGTVAAVVHTALKGPK